LAPMSGNAQAQGQIAVLVMVWDQSSTDGQWALPRICRLPAVARKGVISSRTANFFVPMMGDVLFFCATSRRRSCERRPGLTGPDETAVHVVADGATPTGSIPSHGSPAIALPAELQSGPREIKLLQAMRRVFPTALSGEWLVTLGPARVLAYGIRGRQFLSKLDVFPDFVSSPRSPLTEAPGWAPRNKWKLS